MYLFDKFRTKPITKIHIIGRQGVKKGKTGYAIRGKKKKFNYFKGKFYCGTRINPEVLIWKYNKKEPETEYITFDGFDVIMHAMIVKLGTYLQKGIEKGKK